MQTVNSFPRRLNSAGTMLAALPSLFFLLGLLNGAWVSRIPALSAKLEISHGELAIVLLSGGLGGLASHWLASRLMYAIGGRKTALYAGLGMCGSLLGIGLSPSVPLLMTGVLVLGLASGCFGVAINDIAATHEKRTGKSGMAGLYALCCAGSLTGVFTGGLIAGTGLAPSIHFLGVGLASALICCCSCLALGPEGFRSRSALAAPATAITAAPFALLPRGALLPLGMLVFFGAMAQNSIAEWSGLFLKEHFGAPDSVAPMAFSAFAMMMLIFRLIGDRLKEHFGAGRLVSAGGIVAALGLLFAVCAPHVYVALVGFALAGIGLSLLFPFVYSAAGKQGTAGIAGIAVMGNIGILAGPLTMGPTAKVLGMQGPIALISLLSVVIAVIAARSSLLK